MKNNKEYWDKIYSDIKFQEMSWYQQYPKMSVDLMEQLHLSHNSKIIDIGGGDSHFVEEAIALGYTNITVLDISETAIKRAKERLGNLAWLVKWIVCDIKDFKPSERYDLWHDRATFHFLTAQSEIDKYVSIAEEGITDNGHLILAAFSEEGPPTCSGLPVKRYSEDEMKLTFQKQFNCIQCFKDIHYTPSNSTQQFRFCIFNKKSRQIITG